jgi:hypothetical protein
MKAMPQIENQALYASIGYAEYERREGEGFAQVFIEEADEIRCIWLLGVHATQRGARHRASCGRDLFGCGADRTHARRLPRR